MNPILPAKHHVPDVELHVAADGRVYLYGSYDLPGDNGYCSLEYHVFSTADMQNFTEHGISLQTYDLPQSPWEHAVLYAPDCVYKNGKYYLFFCTSGNGEGVAVSENPAGPFEILGPVEGAHGDSIDPAVFVDDDGSCYYFWGQFHLKGARLTGDMMSLEENSITDNILTEEAHGFHEGACIRKRNGVYYLLYTDISRGRATCISYATAKSPLGPYTKGGVIVDNTGCDPQTWNNHGSMEEVGGKWYIVYHRSSQNSVFSRRVCVEPISFDEAGAIGEVEMTTQGAGGAICAADTMEAWRACLVHNAWTDAQSYGPDDYQEYLQMYNGSWAGFKYLDFGTGVSAFEATAASHGYGGTLTLHLDAPDGPVIGTLSLGRTGGWQKWETAKCAVSPVTGVHALFITCEGFGSKLLNLLSFRFMKK